MIDMGNQKPIVGFFDDPCLQGVRGSIITTCGSGYLYLADANVPLLPLWWLC